MPIPRHRGETRGDMPDGYAVRLEAVMKAMLLLMTGLCAAVGISTVSAGAGEITDVSGSKDHPLMKRYDGAVIVHYDHKAFDEYTVPLGKEIPNAEFQKEQFIKSLHLEGEVTRIVYSIPNGRSPLEVMRNYEQDLKRRGFTTAYTVTGGEAERMFYISKQFDRAQGSDHRFSVWKLARVEGNAHVILYALSSIGDPYWNFASGQTQLQVHVIVDKSMDGNKLVGADEMAEQITTGGRVALYGIYFDTNKTDIKPESEPTLQEIAKLLTTQPSLKLLVVGHTDNVGTLAANMDLSQRRAQAVVNALLSKKTVGKDRLMPVGVSFAAPMASNQTEEGRAKNRRVELVQQ